MSDPNSATTGKKKKLRSKRRSNGPVCVSYDNPDIKVVVRLLPPTLPQADFLHQLEALSPSIGTKLPWTRFFYSQGSRIVQPFEEPKYSRAYFLFSTKDTADRFRAVTLGASFLEPESGDLFLAQTMKPIFGAVAEIPPATTIGDISSDPLFIKFMALRAAKAKNIDLTGLVLEMRAEKKKKRSKKAKKPAVVEKKGKQKPRTSTPRPDPATNDTKADEAKSKRKRKRRRGKVAEGIDAKTDDVNPELTTAGPKVSAKEVAAEAGGGTPTAKPKKKRNRLKKSKQKNEAAAEPDTNKPSASVKPRAEKVPDKSSDPKNDGNNEKKKRSRSRKRKPKPKAGTSTGPSPPSLGPKA